MKNNVKSSLDANTNSHYQAPPIDPEENDDELGYEESEGEYGQDDEDQFPIEEDLEEEDFDLNEDDEDLTEDLEEL